MTNILGINLSTLSQKDAWKKILEFVHDNKQHYIVTPNPEIILESHKDEEFFHILNEADLSIADGFGLKLAGLLFGRYIPRMTGADITVRLLKLSRKENIKVAILNWNKGLSKQEEIIGVLEKKYPGLNFLVKDVGRDKYLDEGVIREINNFAPTILFTALGFPYQEKVIFHNMEKLLSVRLALGIGGSFDFITGRIKRAPKTMRRLGIEWLWRLMNAFKYVDSWKRIRRIYQAIFVFSLKVLRARFIFPWLYRPNVVCWLYKKEGAMIKVLLVKRSDEEDHWQLPQGGTDGESIEMAGKRELSEELNTDKFITKTTFKKLHKYKFPKQKRLRAFQTNYKGQQQGLYIAEFIGGDADIRVNFWDHSNVKWSDINHVVNDVHEVREGSTKIFLDKFNSLNIK